MIEILKEHNFWDDRPVNTGLFRNIYINRLQMYLNSQVVKVISGQRRCGKSYLLRMLIHHLIQVQKVPPQNILYINKDLSAFDVIENYKDLNNAVGAYKSALKPQGKCFLLFDEVQEIAEWEKSVNSFSQDHTAGYEIFITGSNANLLSNELSTLLSGRYVTLELFPFSYSEFLQITNAEKNKNSFLAYLTHGGIPETFNFTSQEIISNYIESLKDSIVLRDIIRRHAIRDAVLLKKIVDFSIDSIGSLLSLNTIVNTLKTSGYKTNIETVGSYFEFLKESYFIHESCRYDIRGKKILAGEKKYYLNDLAFKYYTASGFDFAVGKYLENAVYLHYKRQGYKVYTGSLPSGEVDFIAEKGNSRIYVQVAYLLSDDSVIAREFGNLDKIRDNYEKLVVSLDDVNLGNRNGIKHVNAWELVS